MVLMTTSWLANGRPRQFMEIWENSRCSMAFHLEVPGGKWQTEFGFPGSDAVAVGTTCVRGDQQARRVGVVADADAVPPAAQRFHGERGGVVVGADVDPPGVRGQVVDPVGHRFADRGTGEIMGVDLHRGTLGLPFAAGIFEWPDQLLLFGVDTDDRLPVGLISLDLVVDIPELGIAIRVLLAFKGFDVGLQTEPLLAQQIGDHVGSDLVAPTGQCGGKVASRARRPPQRRHRIPALVGLHQPQQRRDQAHIEISHPFTTTAGPTDPPQRGRPGLQLGDSP
jgi:hypothetical protein